MSDKKVVSKTLETNVKNNKIITFLYFLKCCYDQTIIDEKNGVSYKPWYHYFKENWVNISDWHKYLDKKSAHKQLMNVIRKNLRDFISKDIFIVNNVEDMLHVDYLKFEKIPELDVDFTCDNCLVDEKNCDCDDDEMIAGIRPPWYLFDENFNNDIKDWQIRSCISWLKSQKCVNRENENIDLFLCKEVYSILYDYTLFSGKYGQSYKDHVNNVFIYKQSFLKKYTIEKNTEIRISLREYNYETV